LIESLWTGYVFGVSLRVLSVMIVFFLIAIGLLRFEPPVPLRRAVLAFAIMAFSLWCGISLVATSAHQALWLQPAVQAALVTVVGFFIYRAGVRRPSSTRFPC